jgi:hypothetical protein
MLNIENRVKQLRLNHMHKMFYNKCPIYMKTNFVRMSDIHNYNIRSNKFNFSIPHCNKTCNGTFFYNGIKDWNSLPDDVKCISNPTLNKTSV